MKHQACSFGQLQDTYGLLIITVRLFEQQGVLLFDAKLILKATWSFVRLHAFINLIVNIGSQNQ